jgi:ferritin-like metal-binding protein YciE
MAEQDAPRRIHDELRDTYDAEKQLTKALPKLAKASPNPKLRRVRNPPEGDAGQIEPSGTGVREPRRKRSRQAL